MMSTETTNSQRTRRYSQPSLKSSAALILKMNVLHIVLTIALLCQSTDAQESIKNLKYGLFIHYIPLCSSDKNGVVINDIDIVADRLNVDSLTRDIESMNVQYVIFTAWHEAMQPMYPSARMESWRPGRSAKRDLVGEIISSLTNKGVRVFLYTHPFLGYHFTDSEKTTTGWGIGSNPQNSQHPNPATFDFEKWNFFTREIYSELLERYGERIDGLFMDEGTTDASMGQFIDFQSLRTLIKSKYPHITLIQNYGGRQYAQDINMVEYSNWGSLRFSDELKWPSYSMPMAITFSHEWCSKKPSSEFPLKYTPEAMLRFTLLQASSNNDGGGVAWAAGPYVGLGWESGIQVAMRQLGQLITPIQSSIFGSRPSTSYPTLSGQSIGTLEHGVAATKSPNDSLEFLHVLTPPSNGNKSLHLPLPRDGKQFHTAAIMKTNKEVELTTTETEMIITLGNDVQWDPVNTTIVLKVLSIPVNSSQESYINDHDSSIKYSGNWEYSRWGRPEGDFENDVHLSRATESHLEISFFGTGINLIGPIGPTFGTGAIQIDGSLSQPFNQYYRIEMQKQDIISIQDLALDTHTLRITSTSGSPIAIDAFKITRSAQQTTHCVANLSPSSSSICENDGYTLTAPSNVKARWFRNSAFISSSSTFNISKSGAYRLETTDAQGCIALSKTIQYEVKPSPQVLHSISLQEGPWKNMNAVSVCQNQWVAFGPTPVVQDGWKWIGPQSYKNSNRVVVFPQFTLNQTGVYTAFFTDSAGCTGSQPLVLNPCDTDNTVLPKPTNLTLVKNDQGLLALTWQNTSTPSSLMQYEVYVDGSLVGTTKPDSLSLIIPTSFYHQRKNLLVAALAWNGTRSLSDQMNIFLDHPKVATTAENHTRHQKNKPIVTWEAATKKLLISSAGSFSYQIMNSKGATVERGSGYNRVRCGNNLSRGIYVVRTLTKDFRVSQVVLKSE